MLIDGGCEVLGEGEFGTRQVSGWVPNATAVISSVNLGSVSLHGALQLRECYDGVTLY